MFRRSRACRRFAAAGIPQSGRVCRSTSSRRRRCSNAICPPCGNGLIIAATSCKRFKPNPAHDEIARWQDRFPEFTLVTQNVDGLHQKAGSRNVVELHGNIWRARCTVCRLAHEIRRSESSGGVSGVWDLCGRTWFCLARCCRRARLNSRRNERRRCELCFVIGTSALVYPAASLPEIAKAAGAFVCEVNPGADAAVEVVR